MRVKSGDSTSTTESWMFIVHQTKMVVPKNYFPQPVGSATQRCVISFALHRAKWRSFLHDWYKAYSNLSTNRHGRNAHNNMPRITITLISIPAVLLQFEATGTKPSVGRYNQTHILIYMVWVPRLVPRNHKNECTHLITFHG